MRTFRILPLMLIGMTCQAVAQIITNAASVGPPVITDSARDAGRVATLPIVQPACSLWLEGCLGEDRGRVLLFLGVVGATKGPLVLR